MFFWFFVDRFSVFFYDIKYIPQNHSVREAIMPVYQWTGLTSKGKKRKDKIEADNEKMVEAILKRKRITPVSIKPAPKDLFENVKFMQPKIKEKDHRTPTGEWRIREKHVTTTMDGDGTAAGDLPYSIEDVPYVVYFHRSYAVHGAFWHRNYGVRMSHGCINLAPLDARRVFFLVDPPLPEGWHGAWSTKDRPGSRVVVHE